LVKEFKQHIKAQAQTLGKDKMYNIFKTWNTCFKDTREFFDAAIDEISQFKNTL
jgi:hypothetical protein